jgi:hypothetical protein
MGMAGLGGRVRATSAYLFAGSQPSGCSSQGWYYEPGHQSVRDLLLPANNPGCEDDVMPCRAKDIVVGYYHI